MSFLETFSKASKIRIWGEGFFTLQMLYPPGVYFVKKPKKFVILSSDKSSERNLSSFDIKNPGG